MFLEALRIPKEATISKTPMTTSQMPTTSVRVASERQRRGRARRCRRCRLMMPTKISQPRPGSVGIADRRHCGRDTAEDEADTDPDGQQQNRVLAMLRKHNTARTSEAAPLMNSRTRPPAETCRVKAMEHLRDAGDQQVGAEEDRGDEDRLARPGQHQDAEDKRQDSGQQHRLPQVWQERRGRGSSHGRSLSQQRIESRIWALHVGKRSRSRSPSTTNALCVGADVVNVPLPAVRAGSKVVTVLGWRGVAARCRKIEATVVSWMSRPSGDLAWWRVAAVLAVAGVSGLSGCTQEQRQLGSGDRDHGGEGGEGRRDRQHACPRTSSRPAS